MYSTIGKHLRLLRVIKYKNIIMTILSVSNSIRIVTFGTTFDYLVFSVYGVLPFLCHYCRPQQIQG